MYYVDISWREKFSEDLRAIDKLCNWKPKPMPAVQEMNPNTPLFRLVVRMISPLYPKTEYTEFDKS